MKIKLLIKIFWNFIKSIFENLKFIYHGYTQIVNTIMDIIILILKQIRIKNIFG